MQLRGFPKSDCGNPSSSCRSVAFSRRKRRFSSASELAGADCPFESPPGSSFRRRVCKSDACTPHRAGDPRETLATVSYSRDRVALEIKTERSAFFSHDTSWSDLSPTRYECRGNRYKRIGTFSGVSKIPIDASPTLHYPPNSRQYAP